MDVAVIRGNRHLEVGMWTARGPRRLGTQRGRTLADLQLETPVPGAHTAGDDRCQKQDRAVGL